MTIDPRYGKESTGSLFEGRNVYVVEYTNGPGQRHRKAYVHADSETDAAKKARHLLPAAGGGDVDTIIDIKLDRTK
jgi:hypothetical protein